MIDELTSVVTVYAQDRVLSDAVGEHDGVVARHVS